MSFTVINYFVFWMLRLMLHYSFILLLYHYFSGCTKLRMEFVLTVFLVTCKTLDLFLITHWYRIGTLNRSKLWESVSGRYIFKTIRTLILSLFLIYKMLINHFLAQFVFKAAVWGQIHIHLEVLNMKMFEKHPFGAGPQQSNKRKPFLPRQSPPSQSQAELLHALSQ